MVGAFPCSRRWTRQARRVVASGTALANFSVVEDSFKGLSAARSAGIPCIVVPNAYTEVGDFAGASLRLASLDDLDVRAIAAAAGRRGG
jgi:beta-phosphoglucomutase-like phosphatase (HAD superfamily)